MPKRLRWPLRALKFRGGGHVPRPPIDVRVISAHRTPIIMYAQRSMLPTPEKIYRG